MIEEILVEELARLFRDNIWKLHKLLESIISDKGSQFVVEYKRPGIQGKTSEKISGVICRSICHGGGSIYQCGQITTAKFDENSSSSECQPNNMIQGTSRGAEKRRS